ncbi:MAG: hypothetical protein KGQ89_04685 [Verrucomicrobia bacterium]|nr:hypothetical protein [Verrucomicrobiota bacterium]
MKRKTNNILAKLAVIAAASTAAHAAMIDVVASYTTTGSPYGSNVNALDGSTAGTADTHWTADNIYILKNKVFVTNGQTLIIDPGTKIYSTLDNNSTPADPTDDKLGALVIIRGAKINAVGTSSNPIVFSTTDELEFALQQDMPFTDLPGVNDGDAVIAEEPTFNTQGRWGGVILLGNAPISVFNASNVNIGESTIEGFQPAASTDTDLDGRADVIEYGGNVTADNSGIMQYVSIRHGGYVYTSGKEINGLTLGGVGSGTTIDHIEVYANADDGIEFFGGTVSCNYMVMAYNNDDSFDIDQGYTATNQFWFAIQGNFLLDGVSSNHDNGGEWDGIDGTVNATNGATGPRSAPTIYNATFIGSGTAAATKLGNDKGNNAIYLDDYFAGKLYNSVVDSYKEHLCEATSDGKGTGIAFANNTIGRFGGGTPGSNLTYLNSAANASNLFFDSTGVPINGNSNAGTDPLFMVHGRDASSELTVVDPRPKASSPLWTANGATLQAGAPVTTTYRGAFGNTNWAAGWTKFSTTAMRQLSGTVTEQITDTDGDGVGDALEATSALTSLGFSASVNNVTPTNLFSSLYTSSSIQDLRGNGLMIGPVTGATATVTLPLFKSTGLNTWTAAGNVTGTVDTTPGKSFFRVETAAPNP